MSTSSSTNFEKSIRVSDEIESRETTEQDLDGSLEALSMEELEARIASINAEIEEIDKEAVAEGMWESVDAANNLDGIIFVNQEKLAALEEQKHIAQRALNALKNDLFSQQNAMVFSKGGSFDA